MAVWSFRKPVPRHAKFFEKLQEHVPQVSHHRHDIDWASPNCYKHGQEKGIKVSLDPADELIETANGRKFQTILADPPWRFMNRTGRWHLSIGASVVTARWNCR